MKGFDYNAEVEVINPVSNTAATATYMGADVDWYIKADNIILKIGKQQVQHGNSSKNKDK